MAAPREIHVISNTHWDREWLYDFRETRMMLVDFFDRLLHTLDTEPRYRAYLLDGQAVPVEDYLEARPEKRDAIVKYVQAGRLQVGPWYTCPEGFSVNGESLARNLLFGHRVAASFGGVMKVGYTPFSYGQNSQMPQIYAGFGIDVMLFYHGVSHEDTKNEFIFEGADGTRLLGSQMSSGARYNFYHNVYRRVLYGARVQDREYFWERGGLPFHLCGPDHYMEHHFLLDPKIAFHSEFIKDAVEQLRDAELQVSTTPYLAFMDGHDSSVADPRVLRIIDEAAKHLAPDKIIHSSLPDLMQKVKAAVRDLEVLKGERRVPKPMGARIHLYSDIIACRTRMKRAAALAETHLQRRAEPFAAIAWMFGAEYPQTSLDAAWKLLLKCHAHDSIAGSGVDDIERDTLHRLRQVTNISKSVLSRALQHIQRQIDNAAAETDDVLLTLFNPSPCGRAEVVTAHLDLPKTSGYSSFSCVEADTGAGVPMQLTWRKPYQAVVNHALDATAMMACDRAAVHLLAPEVPAFGYLTLRVVREQAAYRPGLVTASQTMENEHLRVRINSDGTLHIRDKATGAEYDHLHYFEDGGEAGNAWMHIEPANDSIVTTRGCPARIALEEDGPVLARYCIEHRLEVPAGLDENGGDPSQRLDGGPNASRRSPERRTMTITSHVTLKAGARCIEIRTVFDNPCKNHRLRALFPSRIPAAVCHVETPFDVVARSIEPRPGEPWAEAPNATFPMQRFVDVSDGQIGLAIINDGLKEYQVTSTAERTIAITLMRAFEVSLTTVSKRWEPHPEMELSQAPGRHDFVYAIYPHAGTWDAADVAGQAERLALPLIPAQVGPHAGRWSRRKAMLAVEPATLLLSALKRSEDGTAIVVRVYNPTETRIDGAIVFPRDIAEAALVDLEENVTGSASVEGTNIAISAPPKRIVTVKVCLGSAGIGPSAFPA